MGLVTHPEHEAHAGDGPHVSCKRAGLGVRVAGIQVLARLDGLAQEAVRVDGRVVYLLGEVKEVRHRRALLGVAIPEAGPEQRMMISPGEIHQPAPKKGQGLIPTERLGIYFQGSYRMPGDAERLDQLVPKGEDVAHTFGAGLCGERWGLILRVVGGVVEKPVGFRVQVFACMSQIVHQLPELPMANGRVGTLPFLPDAGDQRP